ncbi:MAG: YegP family protein [Bacteroidia bacterium]|nr:YegP family protein [Bacteroidia bacterium]
MFEIYQSEKSKEFYFRLKARNGQVILTSEGYSNKSGAQNGVESVKKNAGDDNRYERKVASNGKHHFSLKAANGQVIGSSQMYASKDSMENGVESVKKNATEGGIKDLTA